MSIEIKKMTNDDINELIVELEIASALNGFNGSDEMYDFRHNAAQGMIMFGGSFTHFLGHALARADEKNTARLIRAFREDCEHHAALYKKFQENNSKGTDNEVI